MYRPKTERAITYADLYAMLGNRNTVAWLTPHAVVARVGERGELFWRQLDESCRFYFSADGKQLVALARSPEHLMEICDVVLRLLAASVVHSVILHERTTCSSPFINTATLAYLMVQCQSLKDLSLHDLEMDESHCRVLGAYTRPDLKIVLEDCTISIAGASALAEVLGRNQGPTKLDHCDIDYSVVAVGLRGNSRLKSLRNPHFRNRDAAAVNQKLLAIAGALKENKGLVDLDLRHSLPMSDETWGFTCDSLKTHPTLQILDLRCTVWDPMATAVLKSRIQALVDMLKVNMSIHTLHLNLPCRQHDNFLESVIPYLATNRFRPRLLAIQKTRPIPYRAKVLGRALLAARTDANSFWMLLSGNPEVAFPSTTATTTPAANLPTPRYSN
jgi:hypothetical protein